MVLNWRYKLLYINSTVISKAHTDCKYFSHRGKQTATNFSPQIVFVQRLGTSLKETLGCASWLKFAIFRELWDIGHCSKCPDCYISHICSSNVGSDCTFLQSLTFSTENGGTIQRLDENSFYKVLKTHYRLL